MKNIEEFTFENKDLFDSEEPDNGHFERFKARQKKYNKKSFREDFKFVLKIAAMVVFVLSLGIFTYNQLYTSKTPVANLNNGVSLGEVSAEYKEVEQYLKSNVNTKLQELKNLKCEKGDIKKATILEELNRLDVTYRTLQKELRSNENDERIINAMINNYQLRVNILNKVITQIKGNC